MLISLSFLCKRSVFSFSHSHLYMNRNGKDVVVVDVLGSI